VDTIIQRPTNASNTRLRLSKTGVWLDAPRVTDTSGKARSTMSTDVRIWTEDMIRPVPAARHALSGVEIE